MANFTAHCHQTNANSTTMKRKWWWPQRKKSCWFFLLNKPKRMMWRNHCAVEIERHLDSHQDCYLCILAHFILILIIATASFFVVLTFIHWLWWWYDTFRCLECNTHTDGKLYEISEKFHLIYCKCFITTSFIRLISDTTLIIITTTNTTMKMNKSHASLVDISTSEKYFWSKQQRISTEMSWNNKRQSRRR